jgi:hypothetical protein
MLPLQKFGVENSWDSEVVAVSQAIETNAEEELMLVDDGEQMKVKGMDKAPD